MVALTYSDNYAVAFSASIGANFANTVAPNQSHAKPRMAPANNDNTFLYPFLNCGYTITIGLFIPQINMKDERRCQTTTVVNYSE